MTTSMPKDNTSSQSQQVIITKRPAALTAIGIFLIAINVLALIMIPVTFFSGMFFLIFFGVGMIIIALIPLVIITILVGIFAGLACLQLKKSTPNLLLPWSVLFFSRSRFRQFTLSPKNIFLLPRHSLKYRLLF